jgi:hypothetical protein
MWGFKTKWDYWLIEIISFEWNATQTKQNIIILNVDSRAVFYLTVI